MSFLEQAPSKVVAVEECEIKVSDGARVHELIDGVPGFGTRFYSCSLSSRRTVLAARPASRRPCPPAASAGQARAWGMIPGHESGDRRPVLLVVLGRGPRACRAPGARSGAARCRDEDRDRPRPARAGYELPAPPARAARTPTPVRDSGRPVGDRPGKRRSAEHRLEPEDDLQDQGTP